MEQQTAVGDASAAMTAQSTFRAPRLAELPPLAFALLLLGTIFLLRIFYIGYVWADEGLWFTAAQELLRGKALYSEIWFDKPPAVAWTYAGLFALAGPSLLAVRLFTILYATLVALALWHLGRRFWGDEEGRLAALLYALYNATYLHSQVQPLAVDHLLLLPYLYAGFLFLYGRSFWSGLLVAVGFWLNPTALALWLFFAAVELLLPKFRTLAGDRARPLRRWGLLLGGFLAGCAPWMVYLLVGGKWTNYLQEFWGWGWSYVTVYSPVTTVLTGLRKTLNYAGFHFPLFLGLALLLGYFQRGKATAEREASHAVWFWLGASFLGVAIGGRFFPHYFYQVLPFLCLLAARGYRLARQAGEWLPEKKSVQINAALRVLFWAGIVFALVWFHNRAAVRAYELVTGRSTTYMATWDDLAIDRDSRRIARRLQWEEVRKGAAEGSAARPAANPGRGPSLFVWGNRPEIYFYCGCPPASKFLSSQPLTGVPADIQLRETRSVAPERAAENRRRLLRELEASRPDYIVDGLGPYNPELAMETYPELRAFLERHYSRQTRLVPAFIYSQRRYERRTHDASPISRKLSFRHGQG